MKYKMIFRTTILLVFVIVAGCQRAPRDITGTWRSDPEMTLPRLAKRDDIPPRVRENIRKTVGQSQITFTDTTVIVQNLRTNAKTEFPYHVSNRTADSISVVLIDNGSSVTNTFTFDGDGFWALQSSRHGFSEFFRKLPNTH